MGLSFHYSGRIASPEQLSEFIDEVQDIAKVHNWENFVFEKQFPKNIFGNPEYDQNIYGICFTPHNCETIFFCFLANGRMSSPVYLPLDHNQKIQTNNPYLYQLSVKTQYAGVKTHLFIINLFRYLNKKYFTDFNITDEGHYWESNDEALLIETFNNYTKLIENFNTSIIRFPKYANETIESYLQRLLKLIHDNKDPQK